MKKTALIVLVLAAMLLGACAPQATATPVDNGSSAATSAPAAPAATSAPAAAATTSSAKPVTLEYWTYSDYAQGKALELQKTFIKEFEASHPGVTINITGKGDDDLTKGELTGAASKSLPDIFMNSTGEGAQLVQVEAVTNVYDKWMAMPDSFRSQFDTEMVGEVSPAKNVMYGLPYTGYATFMYRNLTVLKKAGIDPNAPIKDWADWLDQMKKIKASGAVALPSFINDPWDFVSIMSGAAKSGEWGIDFSKNVTLINPDEYAATAQFLLDAKPYSTELGLSDQGTADLFLNNQLAYYISGPWADPAFEDAKKNGLDYDYALIPGQTADQKGGVRGTEFIGIAPNAHADIAWEFATYICDEAQMSRWAEALGRFNSNTVALNKIKDQPLLQITVDAAKDSLVDGYPLFVKAYPVNYNQALLDNLASIEQGSLTPADGAKSLIDQLNPLIVEDK
jgi:multiple sugar transport system substrate-binding protein